MNFHANWGNGNMKKAPRFEVFGLTGIPEISTKTNLGRLISYKAESQNTPIMENDVIVVAQKIVSKSENRLISLKDVQPSSFAKNLGLKMEKNPQLIELILSESKTIIRMDIDRGVIITETKHGFVCANAGIDLSNVPGDGVACLLPEDPDKSADLIRSQIADFTEGFNVGVIISDTFGRPWRMGQTNIALGISGISPFVDYQGSTDSQGRKLTATLIAQVDEIAGAAEIVMRKSDQVPVAVIRGIDFDTGFFSSATLIRDKSHDLFR